MKKWQKILCWVCAVPIVILFMLVALVCCSEDTDEALNAETSTEIVEEQVIKEEASLKEAIPLIEEVAKIAYSEYDYDIYVEEDYLYLDVWMDDLSDHLANLMIANTKEPWDTLVNAFQEGSKAMTYTLQEQNIEGNIVYQLKTYIDEEPVIFISCMNGYVLFDMWEAATGKL